tara:strand:+ start:909 stop:1295 length:387 start_codon:yes stop_codon:yes gene_type:complete
MENKNNPLSPHIQIYNWHISSLLSITHRIVGVVNIIAIIFVCSWIILLSFGEPNYEFIQVFSQSFFGKFFIIALSWSFSFHTLNEIRHLVWDMGHGYDLKISQVTGIVTIFGSFILAILIYIFGRNII